MYQFITTQLGNISLLVLIINAILHVLFAGAIARDTGRLQKQGIPTFFFGPATWIFATLIGGILIVGLYWLMHYSSLSRKV